MNWNNWKNKMEQLITCRNCKTKLPKKEAILHASKKSFYFCSDKCLAEFDSKALSTSTKKSKTKTDVEKKQYRELTDYIQNSYLEQGVVNIDWGKIGTQLKYLENNNYKHAGIRYTLYYFHEILGCELPTSFFLKTIIENYYSTAQDYYNQTRYCNMLGTQHIIQTDRIVLKRKRQLQNPNLIDLSKFKGD